MVQLRMFALPNHPPSALYGTGGAVMACQVPTKVFGGLSLCLTPPGGTQAADAGNLVIAAMDLSEHPSSSWRAFEKTNPLVDALAQVALSAPAQTIIRETSFRSRVSNPSSRRSTCVPHHGPH